MSSPLSNPFRPPLTAQGSQGGGRDSEVEMSGSTGGGPSGSYGGALDQGSDQRRRLKVRLYFFLGAFALFYVVVELDPFGFGDLFASLHLGLQAKDSGAMVDDEDYEDAKFTDERGLKQGVDPEDDGVRSVAEANKRAGIFRRLF